MAIQDMNTFTQPVPADRHRERLAVVVAGALDMARDNVRKAKLDPAPLDEPDEVPGDSLSQMNLR